jgi:protein subunit release factor A
MDDALPAAVRLTPESLFDPTELHFESWGRGDPMMDGSQRNPRGIQVTHLPSGLSACYDEEKSQLRNKQEALALLADILLYSG